MWSYVFYVLYVEVKKKRKKKNVKLQGPIFCGNTTYSYTHSVANMTQSEVTFISYLCEITQSHKFSLKTLFLQLQV